MDLNHYFVQWLFPNFSGRLGEKEAIEFRNNAEVINLIILSLYNINSDSRKNNQSL